MELLLSHISFLLGEHRVVPVVGLGTFVRVDRLAAFANGCIEAPAASIEFHQEVDPHTGRIVESSVARATGLPLAEASALVDDEVAALTRSLYSGSPVTIEGVGTLSCSGSSINFTPAVNVGWSALGWYAPVDAAPLVQEEEPAPVVSNAERETFMRSLRRTASSAAAVAVLILITFITSQLPGRRGGGEPTYATFGVETTATVPSEALVPLPGAIMPTVVLIINTPADAVIDVEQKKAPLFTDDDPYVLVVASLANEREVDRYMDAHPDEELGLLTVSGRFRVFAATGSSVASLKERAEHDGIYSRFPNAWICRR